MTPDQINARIAYDKAAEELRKAEHGTVRRKRLAFEKAALAVLEADIQAERESKSEAA